MSSMNNAFEEALKKKAQMKADEEAKKNSSGSYYGEYETVKHFGLEDQKERVFRILGKPAEVRTEGWEAKIILQSRIAKEDGKSYFKVNWPYVEKDGKYVIDPKWILSKLYNKVMEKKWKDNPGKTPDANGKTGKYCPLHEGTQIYSIIKNNFKEGEKYPKSVYPSTRILMNVIDRHDSWCKDNNHTKVLSSKVSVSDKQNADGSFSEWPDTGIPKSVYESIFDHMSSVGHWDIDYVVIKDLKKEPIEYRVWDITDTKYLKDPKTLEIGISTPITNEELSYVKYDLDNLYKVTSANKLKKNWIGRFKLCDAELGTNFTEELELLCKKEDEERAILNAEAESKKEAHSTEVKREVEVTTQTETKVEASSRRSTSTEAVSVSSLCASNFPKYKDLPAEEQTLLASKIEYFEGSVPVYYDKKDGTLLCSNRDCMYVGTSVSTGYPEGVSFCPVCGAK